MKHIIQHAGTVERVADGKVFVAVEVGSACGSCASRKACSMQEVADRRIIKASAKNADLYKVGDKVTVAASAHNGVLAVVISYVLPLILLIAGLVLNNIAGISDGVSVLIALGVLAVYYFVLYLLRQRVERRISFYILEN